MKSNIIVSCLMTAALFVPSSQNGQELAPGSPDKQAESRSNTAPTSQSKGAPRFVSMIAVIADPWRSHGQEVYLVGLVSTYDGSSVAVNRESAEYSIGENCIYLDIRHFEKAAEFKKEAHARWCRLRGVIDASQHGPDPEDNLGLYACVMRLRGYAVRADPRPATGTETGGAKPGSVEAGNKEELGSCSGGIPARIWRLEARVEALWQEIGIMEARARSLRKLDATLGISDAMDAERERAYPAAEYVRDLEEHLRLLERKRKALIDELGASGRPHRVPQ